MEDYFRLFFFFLSSSSLVEGCGGLFVFFLPLFLVGLALLLAFLLSPPPPFTPFFLPQIFKQGGETEEEEEEVGDSPKLKKSFILNKQHLQKHQKRTIPRSLSQIWRNFRRSRPSPLLPLFLVFRPRFE